MRVLLLVLACWRRFLNAAEEDGVRIFEGQVEVLEQHDGFLLGFFDGLEGFEWILAWVM